MKSTFNIIIACLMAAITLGSCKAQKQVVDGNNSQNTTITTVNTADQQARAQLQAIAQRYGSWRTLKVNGNIKISGSKSFSSGMQMRMVNGQAISISLRPLLGIEAGKLLIVGDSIFVIDKVHRTYIAERISLLTAGIPVTLDMVQDMFLGRAFIAGDGTLTPSRTGSADIRTTEQGGYEVTPKSHPAEYSYSFAYDSARHLCTLTVTPADTRAGTYNLRYRDVRTTTAGDVAHSLDMATAILGENYSLALDYSTFTWNEQVDVDTTVPRTYRRTSGKNLSSLFEP